MRNRTLIGALALVLAAVLTGGSIGFLLYAFWDLPEVRTLEEYRPSITTRVYSGSNRLLAEFFLENRTPVSFDDVPPLLISALIATEDARFFSHRGVDLRGIARALSRNIRGRRVLEGGSTLTQQLAKVLFLTPERSYSRKLKEIALAMKIEQRYTKREILSLYVNQIYFGSGAYGVEAAAQTYFGKTSRELTLPECALLAGIPRSPSRYSPFRSRERARDRRSHVLNRMVATGVISPSQAAEARRTPLPERPAALQQGTAPAPYFVEYVRQMVEERFGSSILYTGGLNIQTTIDDAMQAAAEEAVRSGLLRLETQPGAGRRSGGPLQSALVALDPATGHILAMVGGRDFRSSQFNRASQALRQPGSAFKPFVFAAAIERGYSAGDLLQDVPLTVALDAKKTWSPENFSRIYQGPVTLRTALAQSLNVPTIRLLSALGVQEVIDIAHRLGIESPLKPVYSLALGSSDVNLLELTSAYAVFANQGTRLDPVAVLMISDNNGRVLYSGSASPRPVLRPETAYLMTNLLRGAVERGTGWKARELGRPVAGKTGTTNDYRDAWFIGYSPQIAAGVWVGYDDQRSLGPKATGSRAALPIWIDFMRRAHEGQDRAEFPVPDTILFRNIDPRSGLLSTERCGTSLREAFVAGTEPRQYCDERYAGGSDAVAMDEAPDERLPQ